MSPRSLFLSGLDPLENQHLGFCLNAFAGTAELFGGGGGAGFRVTGAHDGHRAAAAPDLRGLAFCASPPSL